MQDKKTGNSSQSQSQQRPMPPRQGQGPAPVGMSITPKEIIDILRRHIILIIFLTFIGGLAGGTTWYFLRKYAPKYTAKTYIEVLSPGQKDPTKIGTTIANKDISYEFRFSKATLIKQQSNLQELIKRDKIKATKWFQQFGNDITKTIENLEDNMGASADRNSSYIIVSMTCGSAEESALIVNEMVDLFIKDQRLKSEAGVSNKLSLLNSQLNDLRDKLRGFTEAMTDIRSTSGITQLGNMTDDGSFRHTITQKLSELEIEKIKLEADLEQIRTSVDNYEERNITDDIVKRFSESDVIVQNLIQRIISLESELTRKQTNLGENHREVQQLRKVLQQTINEKDVRLQAKSQQIQRSDIRLAKDQLSILTNRMAKLEEMRAETENEQRELDSTMATYDQLFSDRDESKGKLFAIQEQINKYNQIKEDAETAKLKLVGLAPPPLQMSSPKLIMFGPGGVFLGGMLGVGIAFLIELMNTLLRVPSDVMKHVNIPLLGMIIHKNLDPNTRKADMRTVVSQVPYSMMSECYRQFRTNLKLSTGEIDHQVIYITSGTAEEGRTTIAANTAATFAAEDKNVLFIDANFRRPSSLEVFPPIEDNFAVMDEDSIGLSGYLIGKCNIEQMIRKSSLYKTSVVDSGKLPENPAELLSGKRMAEFIKYAKEHYDRIIIDGPPMLVSDAKSLASIADGTVVVFNTAISKRGAARRIVRELREINTNLLGSVLLGVRVLKGGYFRELFESYKDYQKPE